MTSGLGLLLPFIALCLLRSSSAAVVHQWKRSEISVVTTNTSSGFSASFAIRVTANRTIAQLEDGSDDTGTFALLVSASSGSDAPQEGTTSCFSTYNTAESIEAIVAATTMSGSKQLGDIATISVQAYGWHTSDYDRTISFVLDGSASSTTFHVGMTTFGCRAITTIASWSDPSQWEDGQVPGVSAEVFLPKDSGMIQLEGDVEINSLHMEDGLLALSHTDCQPGWSPGSYIFDGLKCYRYFADHETFDAAQAICTGNYPMGNSLMRPVTDDQLAFSRKLCRDDRRGCWIGVRAAGEQDFVWAAPLGESDQPKLLRGWARREPRNYTAGGQEEACVMIKSFGQELPTGDELSTWKSSRCNEQRPFICEHAAVTTRHKLKIIDTIEMSGGGFQGAGIVEVHGNITVVDGTDVGLLDSATILLLPKSSGVWAANSTTMTSGARVELREGSSLTISSAKSFGWPETPSARAGIGPPPELVADSGSVVKLNLHANQVMHANLFMTISGALEVSSGMMLNNVGGNFAHAQVELQSAAEFTIGGGSASLQTDGEVTLSLLSASQMVGSDYAPGIPSGVYRLTVKDNNGIWRATECIPFNATATELHAGIAAAGANSWLSLVVRETGVGRARDQFAISYRIGYDHSLDGLPVSLSCVGSQGECGCSNIMVLADMSFGTPMCADTAASTDPTLCAIVPNVVLHPRVVHGQIQLFGDGKVSFLAGSHRLPAVSTVPLHLDGGDGVILAASVAASEIVVANRSTLFIAGAGAAGFDAVTLTFAQSDTPFRSIPDYLQASTFEGSIENLNISGYGKLLTPVSSAQLEVHNLVMTGGVLGGRMSMTVTTALFDAALNKQIRYGADITCLPDGTMQWNDGNLIMSEAAAVHVAGVMDIQVDQQTMGLESTLPAEILQDVQSMPYVIDPLPATELRDYSSNLAEPKLGWYQNPLCAPDCDTLPLLHVGVTGQVRFSNNTRAEWNGELQVSGQLKVLEDSQITMQGVGAASHTAQIEVSAGSFLDFRSDMAFDKDTPLVGEGVVGVSGPGTLVMPSFATCALIVNGGDAQFTQVSHNVRNIVLQGGQVLVPSETYETTISIEHDFNMSDGLWIFPHNENSETDPDSPYVVHEVNVNSNMDWTGGQISGSGIINVRSAAKMFLGGVSTTLGPDTRISNEGVATMGPDTHLYIESGSGIDYVGDGSIEAYIVGTVGNLLKAGAEGTEWAPHSWD